MLRVLDTEQHILGTVCSRINWNFYYNADSQSTPPDFRVKGDTDGKACLGNSPSYLHYSFLIVVIWQARKTMMGHGQAKATGEQAQFRSRSSVETDK